MKQAKKQTKSSKKQLPPIKARRFWLVIGCAIIVSVWFILYILAFEVLRAILNGVLDTSDPSSYTYDILHILGGPVTLLVSAVVTIPLAYPIFKKLRLERPFIDAVGLMLSLVFALSLFSMLLSTTPLVEYAEGAELLIFLAAAFFVSVLTYGLILRFAVKRLSVTIVLCLMVLLPLAAILIEVFYRLSLTPLL